MEFISARLLLIFHGCITYGHFLGILPMNYNAKIGQLESSQKYFLVSFMKYFFPLHQIFLAIRFHQSFCVECNGIGWSVLQVGYFSLFALMTVVKIILANNNSEWITYLNQQLKLYKDIGGNFNSLPAVI